MKDYKHEAREAARAREFVSMQRDWRKRGWILERYIGKSGAPFGYIVYPKGTKLPPARQRTFVSMGAYWHRTLSRALAAMGANNDAGDVSGKCEINLDSANALCSIPSAPIPAPKRRLTTNG